MDLANLRKSPLEIAIAQPDAHGNILLRDIYSQPPLELSTYGCYRNDEIMLAAAKGNYPEDFQQALAQMLGLSKPADADSAPAGGKATPWRLWQALINPQLVTLNFYRYQDDYSAAHDGLKVFQNNVDNVSLRVVDATALGLVIHRPKPDLTVDFEISGSGHRGTYNLRLAVQEDNELVGSVALSLLPRE